MTNNSLVIDLDFGISQLSGNRTLYVSLLQKLADEYQDLPGRLDHALAENRWDDVRIMVHTLKGVAGNMGCNLLHLEAHKYEQAIKESHTVPASHRSFIDALSQTMLAISALAAETNDSPNNTQQRDAFITALSQHEFISEEQLDKWLNELAIPASQHESIRDAIDELDYDIALALVKKHSG